MRAAPPADPDPNVRRVSFGHDQKLTFEICRFLRPGRELFDAWSRVATAREARKHPSSGTPGDAAAVVEKKVIFFRQARIEGMKE